jgi:serine/threonine-protein kinase
MLGAGGMGEVYRARDSKLNRDVALKMLPPLLATDPDRLARFKREAQVLASLNHSHIAAIYGFEEAAGVQALVLELVEGPTLADRIAQGPMPVEEALAIATQIAEALKAAHARGIVHRDLKPANVKVRVDGSVKVLDFGLAKAVGADGGTSEASATPTITSPALTRLGVILGTAAYMSPEQARGMAGSPPSALTLTSEPVFGGAGAPARPPYETEIRDENYHHSRSRSCGTFKKCKNEWG